MQALKGIRGLRGLLSLATTSGLAAGITLALLPRAAPLPAGTAASLLGEPTGPVSSACLASLAASGHMSTPLVVVAGAALCGLLNRALGRLERRFLFTDYLHWNK